MPNQHVVELLKKYLNEWASKPTPACLRGAFSYVDLYDRSTFTLEEVNQAIAEHPEPLGLERRDDEVIFVLGADKTDFSLTADDLKKAEAKYHKSMDAKRKDPFPWCGLEPKISFLADSENKMSGHEQLDLGLGIEASIFKALRILGENAPDYCGFAVGYLVARVEKHIESGKARDAGLLRKYADLEKFQRSFVADISEKEWGWEQNIATSHINRMRWLKDLIEKNDEGTLFADYVCGYLINFGNLMCEGNPFSLIETIRAASKNRKFRELKEGSPEYLEHQQKIEQLKSINLYPQNGAVFDSSAKFGRATALAHIANKVEGRTYALPLVMPRGQCVSIGACLRQSDK